MSGSPRANAPLPEWLSYLERLHPREMELGLGRVGAVLKRLNPALPYLKITVGGTNGKGSTCAMLEAMLQAAGYRVGLYTSPHLLQYNERFRIDGRYVEDATIVTQFERIEAARGDISLSYFEFATLAALLMFEDARVDVAICEVGLGGRLDAINIIDPDAAVVTSVDIDHAEYLGTDREQIGFEKAHIFRAGCPAVCADPAPPQRLVQYAADIGADLWCIGRDFHFSGDRQQWRYAGREQRRSGLAYPALRGANQLLNASAALAVLEALGNRLVVPQQAVRLGLAQARLPGRFQILPGQPMTILDVAHNPHAAAALAHSVSQLPPAHTHAVVGMYTDKDRDGVLTHMLPWVDHWHCAGLEGPRGSTGDVLADKVREVQQRGAGASAPAAGEPVAVSRTPGVRATAAMPARQAPAQVSSYVDAEQAFAAARQMAGPNDRILVFGSFATVGPVMRLLGLEHPASS